MNTPLPDPFRFSIAGKIAAWDPVTRALRIAGRELWVPADVSGIGLVRGLAVIAHGHRDQRAQRWIMTSWTLEPTIPHAFPRRD